MEDFEATIQAYFGQLPKEELDRVYSYFHKEKLQKNTFFATTGQTCEKLSIVKSGILRIYANLDGKEITQWITSDNELVTDVGGFFFNQPSRWDIQALTEIELWTISKQNYQKLCQEIVNWNMIEKGFVMKCFVMIEDRVFSHLAMTAEQRYDAYFEKHGRLFNQVPLQYIASILGMTAETFSRIRNRKSKSS